MLLAVVTNPPDAPACFVPVRMAAGDFVVRNDLVVPVNHVEAAVGSELKHTAVVATLATLNAPLEDFLFIGKLVALEREAADALAHKIGG